MSATLLADPAAIRLARLFSEVNSLALVVVTTRRRASCPRCGVSSARVHSRYSRTVADLPWQGVAVRLDLHARRFRCVNDLCEQRIFCEPLPSVVARYARKTSRLSETLALIGFALGGRPGARLSVELAMRVGRDTLLRLVKRAPQATPATPRVLGVDDFAFRRGVTYGTILVDLERRRPIDLLADREAQTLAAWLREHPGVEIISRDRGGAYSEGARTGAPDAMQVADRWHLLKNLGDTLEQVVSRLHGHVRRVCQETQAAKQRNEDETLAVALGSVQRCGVRPRSKRDLIRCAETRARRTALYQEIVSLSEQGVAQRAIARRLHLARNTVRGHLRGGAPREIEGRGRRSPLAPFESYIIRRFREGCTSGARLWREVQGQGFRGSVDAVQRYVAGLRGQLPPDARSQLQQHTSGRVPQSRLTSLAARSPREVVWLLLREPAELKEDAHELLDRLLCASAELKSAYALAQNFQQLVRGRDGEGLETWLDAASKSAVREVRGFAFGLRRDHDAVRAALTSEWSNGQVEGQVNRVKTIKRAMYGRAGFELLRARVLHDT
jgi:transposase